MLFPNLRTRIARRKSARHARFLIAIVTLTAVQEIVDCLESPELAKVVLLAEAHTCVTHETLRAGW